MSRSSPSRVLLNLELSPSQLPRDVAYHAVRWSLLLAVALLTYVLYPVAAGFEFDIPEEGRAARDAVDAPFDFIVPKSAQEIEREAAMRAATVAPVLDYRPGVADSVIARSDTFFTALAAASDTATMIRAAGAYGVRLTPEEAAYLRAGNRLARFRTATRRHIATYLARGVTPPQALDAEVGNSIVVRRGQIERAVPRDSVLRFQSYLELRSRTHPDPNSALGDLLYSKLLATLFRPTLAPNMEETQRRRDALRATVDTVKDRVVEGERIIGVGDIATPERRDRLFALRQALVERGRGERQSVAATVGRLLENVLILSVFWLLLMLYRQQTYRSIRHLAVLAALFGLVVAGSAMNRSIIHAGPALIPIPFAAMMITVLFSGRAAMVAAMVLAVLLGTQAAFGGVTALFVALVGGVVAAVSVRGIRRRNQVLTSFAWITVGYLLAGLAVGLIQGLRLIEIGEIGLSGGVNAFISGALVLITLPVFESLARVTTDLTLLELSDPSRPLLRRLATEAPGTYAHSIAMANLCEPTCNAIGANGLLARVGCYYHDVGKLKKPQFFVENQVPGMNPHDKLKPDVSAGIIRNHVRDGLALAEEHALPDAVRAFIPEHHGTMEITYFLDRARQRNAEPEIDPHEFRYPGPRPRSVETAVTMVADGVEAALRVLEEPTEDKLAGAIDHIIRQRIEAGQLDEAPLTLAQLARVKQEFMRVLASVYHNRIDYPAATGGIGAAWEAKAGA